MAKIYLLNNLKYDGVENLEVFQIEYIKSDIDLKIYDALIFTSKNAIKAIDSFNKDWINIPAYAIAPKTGKVINKYNGNLSFVGDTSHGNSFAKELIPLLKNKKVLYVKALKTVSNLVEILKENDVDINELTAYKTSCKKSKIMLENDSIFIFTSPSSVECFFKNYQWHSSYKAVSIGKTTSNYLPKDINYKISAKTSMEDCIKLALEMMV